MAALPIRASTLSKLASGARQQHRIYDSQDEISRAVIIPYSFEVKVQETPKSAGTTAHQVHCLYDVLCIHAETRTQTLM